MSSFLLPLLLVGGGTAAAMMFLSEPASATPKAQPSPAPPPHGSPPPPPPAAQLATFTTTGPTGKPLSYLDDNSASALDQVLAQTYLRQLDLPPQLQQQMTVHELTRSGSVHAKQSIDLARSMGLAVLVTTARPLRLAIVRPEGLVELASPGRNYAVYRPRPGEPLGRPQQPPAQPPPAPPQQAIPLQGPPPASMPPSPPFGFPAQPPAIPPYAPALYMPGGMPPQPLAVPPAAPSPPAPVPPTAPTPPAPAPPAPVAPPPPAPPPAVNEQLPAAVQTEVNKLMADPSIDPWALDEAAKNLQSAYPRTAAMLRGRANELRTAHQMRDQQRGGSEWLIREGDIASRLALHFTGNALRWKEIPQVNPGMTVKTVNGTTVLHPWIVGSKVLLPVSWAVWAKPPPPVARGSKSPAADITSNPVVDSLRKELGKLDDFLKQA